MNAAPTIGKLETEIRNLEAEVKRLVDLTSIRDLRIRYVTCVNEDRPESIADLFCEDAVVDFGNELGRAVGKTAIEQRLVSLRSAFIKLFPHNHMIDIYGDTARGHLFVEGRLIVDGKSFITAGKVTDTYIRQNGRWLIHTSAAQTYYATPLADGWAALNPVQRFSAP